MKILKSRVLILCLAIILFVMNRWVWAYTDEIGSGIEETWVAAKEVLEPLGIKNSDPLRNEIETRWVKDYVERTNRVLPFKGFGGVRKSFARRYRLKVRLRTVDQMTEIAIKGVFQQKPWGQGPQFGWQNVKPKSEDYSIERDTFFKILQQIEKNRRTAVSTSST